MLRAASRYRDGVGGARHGQLVEPSRCPVLASNTGGNAEVTSVPCASAGNCAAGGYYLGGSDHLQAFVVSEKSGTWGKAIEVPGSAALNVGGIAQVYAVSWASAGNCSAGGSYQGATGTEALVVSEKSGTWGKAVEAPGLGHLERGGKLQAFSVSCGAAGNCAAAGVYTDGSGAPQAFVVHERNGTWGGALEVPGSGSLNSGGNAEVQSVSCTAAGTCSAGGSYTDGSHHGQAFVVAEQDGYSGTAPGGARAQRLNAGGIAGIDAVSCASAGLRCRRSLRRQFAFASGVRRQREQRHLGQRHRDTGLRHPERGRRRRGPYGVLRLGR